jgi:lysophospholipase L1-like esterase
MSQRIEQLDGNFTSPAAQAELAWHDASRFEIRGRGWADVETWSDRLPARARQIVSENLWTLSHHSAGLCVPFETDSARIAARWKLRSGQLAMPHMPATGVSGVDLYLREGDTWRWAGSSKAVDRQEMCQVIFEASPQRRSFQLWLPLYNGVKSLEIGLDIGAELRASPNSSNSRIVFFGSSIVQGACASRPGMAYPAILSRRLDVETINLGFSGNGQMDLALAPLLGEIDAGIFVIDSLPNMQPQQVSEIAATFVRALRDHRPDAHIVLIENIVYQNTLAGASATRHGPRNAALRSAYERLIADGCDGVTYVAGDDLLGHDWDATVDGTHPTDLGFRRIAEVLLPVLRQIQEQKQSATAKGAIGAAS